MTSSWQSGSKLLLTLTMRGVQILAAQVAPMIAVAVLSGCAPRKAPVVLPDTRGFERLAAADAQLREGCLDCLVEAFHDFDALRATPARQQAGVIGAIRSATLVALRQRELGMVDEGYLQRARDLLPIVNDPAVTEH